MEHYTKEELRLLEQLTTYVERELERATIGDDLREELEAVELQLFNLYHGESRHLT